MNSMMKRMNTKRNLEKIIWNSDNVRYCMCWLLFIRAALEYYFVAMVRGTVTFMTRRDFVCLGMS